MPPFRSKHNTIYFDDDFNKPLKKTALDRISKNIWINFNDEFNQPIDEIEGKPMFIKLGRDFNQPIQKTPFFLRGITFGSRYDQPIENLTKQLHYITFGKDFNQPIDELGDWIEELEIGERIGSLFNQNINHLSTNLKIFIFRPGLTFNKNINFERNDCLKKIVFAGSFNQLIVSKIYNIEEEELDEEELEKEELEKEELKEEKNSEVIIFYDIGEVIKIPNLLFLCLGKNYTQSLNFLPDSIEYLYVGYDYGAWNDRDDKPEYTQKYFRKISEGYDITTIKKLPASLQSFHISTNEEGVNELRKKFPGINIGSEEYIDLDINQI